MKKLTNAAEAMADAAEVGIQAAIAATRKQSETEIVALRARLVAANRVIEAAIAKNSDDQRSCERFEDALAIYREL